MSLYRIDNLKKKYEDRLVLDIPELSIEAGKIYGLIGPNGSGKTTLLMILAFLEPPSEGIVRFEDRPVSFSDMGMHRLRRQVVLVDQKPIMFSASTLRNVAYGPAVRGVPRRERRRIAMDCLDRVGLAHLAHARGDSLSGGETQRAAIARALACGPRVIFLDEPTANVDAANRIIIERIIRQLQGDQGITVILTSHDAEQVARLCHESILLVDGRPGSFQSENSFRGEVVFQGQKAFCRIAEHVLLPLGRTPALEDATVNLDAGLIRLCDPEAIDGQPGECAGRIIQMSLIHNKVKAVVEIGLPLAVLAEPDADSRIGQVIGVRWPMEAVHMT